MTHGVKREFRPGDCRRPMYVRDVPEQCEGEVPEGLDFTILRSIVRSGPCEVGGVAQHTRVGSLGNDIELALVLISRRSQRHASALLNEPMGETGDTVIGDNFDRCGRNPFACPRRSLLLCRPASNPTFRQLHVYRALSQNRHVARSRHPHSAIATFQPVVKSSGSKDEHVSSSEPTRAKAAWTFGSSYRKK